MTIRISPNLLDTNAMLGEILTHILADGTRVAFTVPSGQAQDVLARIRTMISRKRKMLESRGKKPKRFQLRSTTHHETSEDGMRMECIVLWKQVDESHKMTEMLEDLLV